MISDRFGSRVLTRGSARLKARMARTEDQIDKVIDKVSNKEVGEWGGLGGAGPVRSSVPLMLQGLLRFDSSVQSSVRTGYASTA
jgi:hypothetical protein